MAHEVNEDLLVKVRHYVDGIIQNAIEECKSSVRDKHVNEIRDKTNEVNYLIKEVEQTEADGKQSSLITKLEILAEDIVTRSMEEGFEKVSKMGRILSVGIASLDIVFVCEEYPEEDSENLVDEHYWSRGGNASNTSSVLAYLGANVEFFGTLVQNRWTDFLKEDFGKTGVKFDNCVFLDERNHKSPVCLVVNSKQTGSRTCFPDFKNVTEVSFGDFDKAIGLTNYAWMHFEGRPKNRDIEKMMKKIENFNKTVTKQEQITMSVEFEPPHSVCPELFSLFGIADVVFISKVYAKDAGFNDKESAVNGLYKNCKPGAILICPWGDQGAAARWNSDTCTSPAFSPDKLVETLGAGDTFNGSVIYALNRGSAVPDALVFACKVAGAKCGTKGYSEIQGMQRLL